MQNNNNSSETAAADDNIVEPLKFEPVNPIRRRLRRKLRVGTLVVAVAFAVSAIIAWYILTGKAVYIESVPAQSQIVVSGGVKLKLADRYLLRQGDYQLRITSPGYHPLEQVLTVTEAQNQHYTMALNRLPGHLQVDTSPAVSADIWLNEQMIGQTPMTITGLEHGTYKLTLMTDRFLPFETDIDIEGLDREQSLTAELKRAWGNVSLESDPPGADIFVDDELVGQTPGVTEILQGEHTLRIKLSGFKDWRRTIRVSADEDQTITNIMLEPADAVVQIITTPDRANITVDGEFKGQSPLEVALAANSRSTINIFKQGYEQATRTVQVKSGDNQTLQVNLNQQIASVRIIADPPDASVYINGILRGNADQTVELSTSAYTIEIRKPGYVDYKTTITPRAGIAQQVSARLKTLEQARQEAIKPIIQTVAGHQLRLFNATAIIMGASRREPGRRANETVRNVQFTRPFYLSETVVTNAQFRKFDSNHASGSVQGATLDGDNHPVVNITWDQAALYCNWLSAQEGLSAFYQVSGNQVTGFNRQADGYRLPTEAEWEWTMRDRGSAPPTRFPWGETMPPVAKSGNYADVTAASILGNVIRDYTDGYITTSPVASFPANAKGLYDLGGNVAEWVHDIYDIAIPSETEITYDPVGPDTGEHHVIRGSSWAHGSLTELRSTFRDYSSEKRNDVGFRIARYLD